MNGGEFRFGILGVLLVGIGILTFSFLYFNTPEIEYTRSDLNKTLTAQVTSSAWSQFWCDVKGFFGSSCHTDSIEYAIITPLRDNASEDISSTSVQVDLTNSPATVINEYYSNTYPVEQEVIKEVIVRDGVVDTSRFITRQEYEAQVDGIMRSIENVDTSGGGTSGIADITSESIEDLEDVASMTKVTGDLLTWTGSAWSNIATSSLGISGSGAVDSVNSQTGVVVLDTDDISEGTNQYFTTARARDTLSSSATGLSYATSTGTFSLTAGYSIPLTASTTEWANKVSSQWTTLGSNIYFNTGNVGIGTTTPSAKLDVTGSAGSSDIFAISSSSNSRILTVTAAGFVGIGTTQPLNNFVLSNAGAGGLEVNPSLTISGAVGVRFLSYDRSASEYRDFIFAQDGGYTVIAANGNVGIGTTTPSSRLTVVGSTTISGTLTTTDLVTTNATTTTLRTNSLSINLSDGCIEAAGGFLTSTGSNCGVGSGGITNLNGLTTSSQSFATSTSGGLNLNITSSGGVHTFTAGLTAGYNIPLTASTTAWNNTYNTVTAGSASWDAAAASTTALTPAYMRGLFSNSTTGLTYNSSTGATSLTAGYVIPLSASTTEWSNKVTSQWTTTGSDIYYTTGNVGIGSTTPSSKLTVQGNTWIGGNLTATGTLAILSTGTSTFAGDIEITGSIVPSANITYDLGTPTRQWRDVYIGPGSLYINGKKVIEDISDTITISTDLDQNLAMKTTGIGTILLSATSTGNLTLESNSGNININSASGNLNIGTTGSGGLNFGTIDSGVWNGTDIDISDFTNLSVSATGLSLSGDAIALTSGYTIPLTASTTEWASKLSNITGLITAGSNVSVTGSGTSGDPYSISSNGSDGVASSSVAFSVHKNGTNQTSLTVSTFNLVTWSTERFDTNSNFASDRFTPTVAGRYILTANVESNSVVAASKHWITAIYKNGAVIARGSVVGGANTGEVSVATAVVEANGTTDYFEVYLFTDDASSVTIYGSPASTQFTGALIAPSNGLAGGWSNDGTQSYLADYTDLVAIGTTTAVAKLDVWGSSGSSDVFRISSSTGARMLTVSADGNIGIGTTSPKGCPTCSSRVLHIEGANAGLRLLDNSGTLGDFLTYVNDGGYGISDVTADTTRFWIGSTGNVGIGTTTPASDAKLTISSPTTESYLMFERSNAGLFEAAIGNNGGSLVFKGGVDSFTVAGLTEFMRISSTGNVGIGTTTPTIKLTSYVNAGSYAGVFGDNTGAVGLGAYTGGVPMIQGGTNTSIASSKLLAINPYGGNVGIGTTTPSHTLSVSSANLVSAVFERTSLFDSAIGIKNTENSWTLGWDESQSTFSIAEAADLNSGNHRLVIAKTTGNVGIGTTTPNQALSVVGRIMTTGSAYTVNPQGPIFGQYDSTTGYAQAPAGGKFQIWDDSTAAIATFADNGNVGIGTTAFGTLNNSGATFETYAGGITQTIGHNGSAASGDAYMLFKRNGTDLGSITQVSSTGVAYNTTSDRRVKDNIDYTTLGLDDLMKLPVRDFSFTADDTGEITTGFIAQELYEIFPWAVTVNGDNGIDSLSTSIRPWSVDYGRITPLLAKSIQDLNLKLEDLATTTSFTDLDNESFTKKFFAKLIAWFADSANGIGTMVANTFLGSEICLKDDEGTTCYTRADFDAMINGEVEETTPPPQNDAPPPSLSTDMCSNLPDIQEEVPEGYSIDSDSGECVADVSDTPEEPSLPDSPISPVLGCTDEEATNYASYATEDDDSCEYPSSEQTNENSNIPLEIELGDEALLNPQV